MFKTSIRTYLLSYRQDKGDQSEHWLTSRLTKPLGLRQRDLGPGSLRWSWSQVVPDTVKITLVEKSADLLTLIRSWMTLQTDFGVKI